jgi:hypothetical protein
MDLDIYDGRLASLANPKTRHSRPGGTEAWLFGLNSGSYQLCNLGKASCLAKPCFPQL